MAANDIYSVYVNNQAMTIVAGTLKFGVDTHKTKSLAVTRGGQRGVLNFSNDAENIQTVEFEIPANVNGINNVDLLLQAYDYNYNSTIVVINEFTGVKYTYVNAALTEDFTIPADTEMKVSISFSGKHLSK
jgi:hypothetical protein